MSPAEHYEKYGAFEANSKGGLLNPSNSFDANAYFAAKLVELQVAGGIEEIMSAAGSLAKGQTAVVQDSQSESFASIKLFISDGAMTSTTSRDYTVALQGVNLPSLVAEVLLDNGFITGFTGA